MKELAGWAVAVPLVVLVALAFVKFAVVLAVLQRAFGAAAVPPPSVTAILALTVALFVTAPVATRAWAGVAKGQTAEPVREWLAKHTAEREKQSFLELQKQLRPEAERAGVGENDLVVLAPAFATAELKSAFQIGFLLFLPFLVIELLVSTVLTSLGMNSLAPELVSLPFKLLLFVLADGWHLMFRGLVLGYT